MNLAKMRFISRTKLMRRVSILGFVIFVVIFVGDFQRPETSLSRKQSSKSSQSISQIQSLVDTLERKTTLPVPVIGEQEKEPKKYNLLMNAYMNSGSRFTGSLFGFRRGAFYFYEPLWRASIWDYFRPPNLVCNTVIDICANMTVEHLNRWVRFLPPEEERNETISNMLLQILEKVYRCDFSHLDALVVGNIALLPSLSGPSWDPFRICLGQNKTKLECIKTEEEVCKRSPHIVTKVLRMTLGSLEPLLWTFPNLKFIHLFRDPRAILNSRINSRYPMADVTNSSVALCRKMIWDLREGKKLQKKYPDRFKFVFYEDLKNDVLRKTEYLSNFIGMKFKSSEVSRLDNVKVNKPYKKKNLTIPDSRAEDNAFWWKSTLSEDGLKKVQEECHEFFTTFGFELYNSKTDLLNSTNSLFPNS